MTKYHIKDDGEPGICEAEPGRCPKKNADGTSQKHYDTYQEAEGMYALENVLTKSLTKNTRLSDIAPERPMTREEEEEIQAMYPDYVLEDDDAREPDYENLSENRYDVEAEIEAREDMYDRQF